MWPFTKKLLRPDDPVVLHGHDLSVDWNYLGYSQITKTRDFGETRSSLVHFFVAKKGDRRSMIVERSLGNHPFVSRARVWAIGEGGLYALIHSPSEFLRLHMSETYRHIWDADEKWWVPEKQSGFQKAASEQKSKRDAAPDVIRENDKVVRIDFTKK